MRLNYRNVKTDERRSSAPPMAVNSCFARRIAMLTGGISIDFDAQSGIVIGSTSQHYSATMLQH
jgi:hypothetical protein